MFGGRQDGLKIWGLVVAALLLAGCGEDDPARAKEAVSWIRMHKHDGLANPIWKITGIKMEDARNIIVDVWVPNPRHVEMLRSQSLMRKSLIAKYACPAASAGIWTIVKDDIKIRVNLHDEGIHLGNAICTPPRA